MADLGQAYLMYECSIELEKTHSVASNHGTLYYTEWLFEKSAAMYEAALEINDGDYLIWGNLAVAYYYTPGMRHKSRPCMNGPLSWHSISIKSIQIIPIYLSAWPVTRRESGMSVSQD